MHAAAELTLLTGAHNRELTPKEQTNVDQYVAGVKSYADGGKLSVEESVVYSIASFGTRDIKWRGKDKMLHVGDYKTGKTPVAVKDNEQLLFLAGDIHEDVALHIWQPQIYGMMPQTWIASAAEVRAFQERRRSATEAYLNTPCALTPGKHCGRCRAKAFCPAQRKSIDAEADAWLS
jgi:hypothetical protein